MVGRSISIDGADWQIVAVMPAWFAIPNREVEIWTQWDLTRFGEARDARFLQTLARLKSGVTIEQAQAQLASVAGASAEQYPHANKGWSVSLVPLQEETVGKSRSALL